MASTQLLLCLFALSGFAAATESETCDETTLLQTSAALEPEMPPMLEKMKDRVLREHEQRDKDGKPMARSPYKTLSDWKMNSDLNAKAAQHPKAHKVYNLEAQKRALMREREEQKSEMGWQEKTDTRKRVRNLDQQLKVAKKDLELEKAHLTRQTRAEAASRIPVLLPVSPAVAPPTSNMMAWRYNQVLKQQGQAFAQAAKYQQDMQKYNAQMAAKNAYDTQLKMSLRDPTQVATEEAYAHAQANYRAGFGSSEVTQYKDDNGNVKMNPKAWMEDSDSASDRSEKMHYLKEKVDRGAYD